MDYEYKTTFPYVIAFQVVNEPTDAHCPVVEMSTRSKLSCLSWNKYAKNQIASSDYEGIVTVWDVTTRKVTVELTWSVCSCISCFVVLIINIVLIFICLSKCSTEYLLIATIFPVAEFNGI